MSCLRLPLHKENHAFSKDPEVNKFLLLEFEMGCSFKVVVCLVKVLELDFDLCNFVECGGSQVVVVLSCSDHLLEVENRVGKIVKLFQCFCFKEVCLG